MTARQGLPSVVTLRWFLAWNKDLLCVCVVDKGGKQVHTWYSCGGVIKETSCFSFIHARMHDMLCCKCHSSDIEQQWKVWFINYSLE